MHCNWPDHNVQFSGFHMVQSKSVPLKLGAMKSIVQALKDQIAEGVYRPGDRLPSSRALASQLGVSRTTVSSAFEQLISEGYIQNRQGAANVVAPNRFRDREQAKDGRKVVEPALSAYARRLAALSGGKFVARPNLPYDFRYGDVSGDDFPAALWKRAVTGALLKSPRRLSYADPAGTASLRKELQAYLWRARGIRCQAEQIVVVSGSQQGIDLCARILVEAGSHVVMEEPGYVMARNVFLAAGASLIPVPCDSYGLMTDALPLGDTVSLVFVTPSHQYPLGGVLPVARREALLDWASASGAFILEDDYDGEYRYDVKPIPPLYQMGEGRVIYLGTVSKTISPTLRLGYMVLPENLVNGFVHCKQMVDRHTSGFEQQAFETIIASGAYERHIGKMRRSNSERRAILIAALTSTFGDDVDIVGSSAGLHVVAWFKRFNADFEIRIVEAAARNGVGIYPIASLYTGRRPERAGFVFGYAAMSPKDLEIGIFRLSEALGRLT